MTEPPRKSLPARRELVTEAVDYMPPGAVEAQPLYVGVGFPAFDTGEWRALEIWLRGKNKVGSERDFLLDDIAVLLSLLMQTGMRAGDILAHLATPTDGEPPSVVSAALRAAVGMEAARATEMKKLFIRVGAMGWAE